MSPTSPERFANLLSEAIQLIAFHQHKNRQAVQDEIGYAIGRNGGTAISYWIYRKRIPSRLTDIEALAQVIARRGGWEDFSNLIAFLETSGHPNPTVFAGRLLPNDPAVTNPSNEDNKSNSFPFVVGPPVLLPRQFFGREWELKRIFNVLQGPTLQNVAVVGKQRSGKTSLLHYIKNITRVLPAQLRPGQSHNWLPESARYLWVFVDFQDPRMCTRSGFFQHVLSQLQIPAPNPCNLDNFIGAVSQQLANPAVILMDELQAAMQSVELDDKFWWGLRSLGTNLTEGRLGFIISTQIIQEDFLLENNNSSPFFNIFGHLVELGPLTRKEAIELIDSSPLPFNQDDIDWILKTSQCWPSLIQALAMACWTSMQMENENPDWKSRGMIAVRRYNHLLIS